MVLPVLWLLLLFLKVSAFVLGYSQENTNTFHPLRSVMNKNEKVPTSNFPFAVHCSIAFLPLCTVLWDSKLN